MWECGVTGRLTRWDAETGERSLAVETGWIPMDCDFFPGGRFALVGGIPAEQAGATSAPGLILVDLPSSAVRWTTDLPFFPRVIRATPDGTRCLVAGGDGAEWGIACYDTSSGSELWQAETPRTFALQFFPDGERFAQTTYNEWDDSVFIRSAANGELLNTFSGLIGSRSIRTPIAL